MRPLVIEPDPLRAAGPVLLGSRRDDAGEALRGWEDPHAYAPYPGALPLDWRVGRGSSGIDTTVHCGSTGVVQTIEIFRDFDVLDRCVSFSNVLLARPGYYDPPPRSEARP